MHAMLVILTAATVFAAAASAAELPAAPLPAPGIGHGCGPGVIHTSTLEGTHLCARPLAMTIIEHHRRPSLRT